MRVFEINVVYGTGSTGRIAADLKHAVEACGGECFAAYGRGKSCENNTARIGNDADMYRHALLTRLTDRTGFYSKKATVGLIEKIREFSPDLIHLHNLHGYYVNLELLFDFLRDYNKPVVWTFHDCWPMTGHCVNSDDVSCEKWKTGCFSCPLKKEYPASNLIDASKKNFEDKKRLFSSVKNLTVVTPSKWLAGLVKESFLKDCDVRVINNGLDLSVFAPKQSDCKARYGLEHKKLLLSVANVWTEKKGWNDLIRLSGMLSDEYRMVIVGLNEKQKASLPENITGILHTESLDELVELYSSADFLLNPTYGDTFPTVNIEALACGTPVITYNTGGSPEILDETCGAVIPCGDVNAFSEALKKDYSRENCKERAKRYSKVTSAENYLRLYREILKLSE